MSVPDDNDRLREGSLPTDPFADAEPLAAAGHAASPPDPIPEPRRWIPFPVHVLPGPCADLVSEGAAALGCDPAYLAVPMLPALAGAIGNRRVLRVKGRWAEPSVVWAAIAAASGTLKSPAQDLVLQPLRDREATELERHSEEVKGWEREMQRWRDAKKTDRGDPPSPPVARRLILNDTTVEAMAVRLQENPAGLLLQRDELAGWLKSFDRYKDKGGGDLQQWLEVHRAGQIIVDRKGSGGRPAIVFVRRAAVSVVGGIQPGILARTLGEEQRESGLAARLLICHPPRTAKTWTETEVAPATLRAYAEVFERIAALRFARRDGYDHAPCELTFSAEAKGPWIDFYGRQARRQNEATDDDLAAAFAKLEGYAARFALIFAVVRGVDAPGGDARVVDRPAMEAAIELAEWFSDETERVERHLLEDSTAGELRKVYEIAVSAGGSLTVRQLMHARRRYRSDKDQARDALEALVTHGWGEWQVREPGPRGGRPTEVFVVRARGAGPGSVTAETAKGGPGDDGEA